MAVNSRNYVRYIQDGDVAATTEDKWNGPKPGVGEVLQLKRIVFADKGINDGLSGRYKVDWGSGGDANREILVMGFLTGNTIDFPFNQILVGDDVKRIRIVRENFSASAREMIAFVELIERN